MESLARNVRQFKCPVCGGTTTNSKEAIEAAKAHEGRIHCSSCNAPLLTRYRLPGDVTGYPSLEDIKDLFSTSYIVIADIEAKG